MIALGIAGLGMTSMIWADSHDLMVHAVDVPRAIASLVLALLFAFHLRVMDDVKDSDTDRIENPSRPVPRGLVTERELDVLCVLIMAIEVAIAVWIGPVAIIGWSVAAAWSVLMRAEFWAPDWLDRHVFGFAISHMAVMGLTFLALMAMGIEVFDIDAGFGKLITSADAWGLALAATLIGLGFEFGRRFERYVAARRERAWTLWLLWPSVGVMLFTLLARDQYPTWTLYALMSLCALTIVTHALIMGQRPRPTDPDTGARRAESELQIGAGLRTAIELAPGLAGLLLYVVLAVAGVMGVTW